MKFDRDYRPWRAAIRPGNERPHMEHVYLDAENGRLMATDGHMAVIIPCVVEEGDRSGFIPREALLYARRKDPGDETVKIDCRDEDVVRIGKTCFERPRADQPFPPVPGIVPKFKAPIRINLDARLLRRLSRVIGATDWVGNVTLTVEAEDNGSNAFLVEAYERLGGAQGILMPLRPLAKSVDRGVKIAPLVAIGNGGRDCPECPECKAKLGTPAHQDCGVEKGRWNGPENATLWCPSCGCGWVGTYAEVEQAWAAWRAYEASQASR